MAPAPPVNRASSSISLCHSVVRVSCGTNFSDGTTQTARDLQLRAAVRFSILFYAAFAGSATFKRPVPASSYAMPLPLTCTDDGSPNWESEMVQNAPRGGPRSL